MPVSSSTEHWIKPDALTINLNHFGDPDYLQVSVLAGAVVMAFKQDVIGYNAAHNYRTWPLEAANTYLETTSAYNVYARLTRSEVNARALVVYDTVLRDIEGREITYAEDGSEVLGDANPEYFFVFLGQISASVNIGGSSVQREWIADFRFGNLNTNQYQNEEAGGEWTKMFRLNKVTDMIDVLKKFSSAIFQKLFIGEKEIRNIQRSVDTDSDQRLDDVTLPTTKFTEDRYLSKQKDDRSSGKIASDKGFEAGKFNAGATGAACYQDKDGNWHIETDHLKVRKKASFTEVEIETTYHVGGQQISTGASMVVGYVLEMDSCYRCYFLKKDNNGRVTTNKWKPKDQAYCNTFNLVKQEDGTLGNHYLWRLVNATSNETADDAGTRTFGDVTINTADYHFTDLSKTVFAEGSDIPKALDEIVLLGHQGNDESRQGCIIVAGAGEGSPYIYEFTGINSFTLPEPETRIKPGDNLFTGLMRIQGGSTGAGNLTDLHIGAVNLLLNSGFTGNYESEDLDESYYLKTGTELYSKNLKHWTGKATVNEDAEAVSNKSATIGNLLQAVGVIKGENYVVSFKAKGTELKVALGGNKVTQALTSEYSTYSIKFQSDGVSTFSISGDATLCNLQLERGIVATDWNPSPYDNDKTLAEFQALKYLRDAIVEGDTTILGGLILSSIIKLGNYKDGEMQKVNAGMSGIYNDDDDVAFWGGGTFEEAIRTVMKFRNDPMYNPTEEEWRKMANFVVSHGGDVFLRGYIHALGGYFRGEVHAESGSFNGHVNAESGVFKNVKSPNGMFSIDEEGNVIISGEFNSSYGKNRVRISPVDNKIELQTTYYGEYITVGSISFVQRGESWDYGEVLLTRYQTRTNSDGSVGYVELNRMRLTPTQMESYSIPDGIYSLHTAYSSIYHADVGTEGYDMRLGLRKVVDGTGVDSSLVGWKTFIQSDCWAKGEEAGIGGVYSDNGTLKIYKEDSRLPEDGEDDSGSGSGGSSSGTTTSGISQTVSITDDAGTHALTFSNGVSTKYQFTERVVSEDEVVKILKVTALPENPDPNTMYVIIKKTE